MCLLLNLLVDWHKKGKEQCSERSRDLYQRKHFTQHLRKISLDQIVIDKEDRFLFEKTFLKTFLRQFGFAESIHNKMPPRQDSRSGLHKRYEPIFTKEVNAHPSPAQVKGYSRKSKGR